MNGIQENQKCESAQNVSLPTGTEKRKNYSKKYYQLHKEKIIGRISKYRAENREHCNRLQRERTKRNPGLKKLNNKKYRDTHKYELAAYNKIWHEQNPDKVRNTQTKYRIKYRSTAKGKLCVRMAAGIRSSIVDGKKGKKWQDLVGYSHQELRNHLEALFKDGMSWDNVSEWHIDHKIPISVFNFKKPTDIDFKKCWALSNLQPLWALDNLKKGNRVSENV
jgi:hypothetical protein